MGEVFLKLSKPRGAWVVLGFALTFIAVLGGLAWVVGGELSAPAPRSIGVPPASLGAEAITFPSSSGSLIHGWYVPGSTGQGAVLLLHGVRGDRRDMLSRAEFLHGFHY